VQDCNRNRLFYNQARFDLLIFPNPYIGLFFPNGYPQFEVPKHLREVFKVENLILPKSSVRTGPHGPVRGPSLLIRSGPSVRVFKVRSWTGPDRTGPCVCLDLDEFTKSRDISRLVPSYKVSTVFPNSSYLIFSDNAEFAVNLASDSTFNSSLFDTCQKDIGGKGLIDSIIYSNLPVTSPESYISLL
jgi:hypothetical protein